MLSYQPETTCRIDLAICDQSYDRRRIVAMRSESSLARVLAAPQS